MRTAIRAVLLGANILFRIQRKAIGAALAQAGVHFFRKARELVGEAARDLVPEDRRMALAQPLEARRQLELGCVENPSRVLVRLAHLGLHAVPFARPAHADARRAIDSGFEVRSVRQRGGKEGDIVDTAPIEADRVERVRPRLYSSACDGVERRLVAYDAAIGGGANQ